MSQIAAHTDAARAHQQLAVEYEDRLRSGYLGLMLVEDDAIAWA